MTGSIVRPKVAKSVHYCEKTQVFHSREYRDGTSLANAVPTGAVYPKEVQDLIIFECVNFFEFVISFMNRMRMEIH